MKPANIKPVPYRRRREQKTNYHQRLRLLLSQKPRVVVRLTGRKVIGQVIQFQPQGDKVLAAADSVALVKLGWNYSLKNMPATYLTGLLLGKKALKAGVQEAALDTGLRSPIHGGRIFAFLKGVVDAGLHVPHAKEVLPSAERISGKHISMAIPKGHQFAQYLKNKIEPAKISEAFEHVKKKI
ncbi:50S ribosomal protein L18 [Candidatus Woesearchaeota archaeon]|nr:50S ribosomal protein L18 [Candidatus Woesearchaeota archaeon]